MRPAGILLWQEIERELVIEIESGTHPVGTKLPTMEELSQRFDVNVHTMRQALTALRERGLISIEQGRGTFVRGPMIEYPLSHRTRFTENVSPQSRTLSSEFHRFEEMPAPAQIAADLHVLEGAKCLFIQDGRIVNGMLVNLNKRYFPLPRFHGLAKIFKETGSITKALNACGVDDYLRQCTRIYARGATAEEAAQLRVGTGNPVLVAAAVNADLDGTPIESNVSVSPGGQFQLVVHS